MVLIGDDRVASRTAREADLCLEERVAPDILLQNLWTVLRSRGLRERAESVRRGAEGLLERSSRLIARADAINAAAADHRRRACPACGTALEWIERGRIDGLEYDYYHWCARGCGLHCYNRTTASWVKLAG